MANDDIQDADVVTENSSSGQQDNAAEVLKNLESMIKSHMTGITKRKSELKKVREMISDALTGDETYRDHEQKAKEAAKLKNATKSQILRLPANAQLVEKMHEYASEIKEMDEALSEYLREYQRMSGSNEIENDDGEVLEIVYVAKLIKKASRNR